LPPSSFRVHAALIAVSLLFGANYVFTKRILQDLPPEVWVCFRITAATLVLVPLALRFGRGRPSLRLGMGLVLAAFLGVVLNQGLFTAGLQLTRADHSAVINACIPTWTLCLAALFGQERFSSRKLVAVVVALAGVCVLLTGGSTGGPGGAAGGSNLLLGDLLTWANGVSFSLHLVLMRKLGPRIDAWTSTAVMFVAATLMIGAWAGPEITTVHLQRLCAPPVVYLAIYAVLFATVFTYSLNNWALRHTRSSQVALYINLQPLVAAALAPAFGLPGPDWRFFTALGLVGTGLWLRTTAK
jgi:drug/metabolite transporter (DMT)-like permease